MNVCGAEGGKLVKVSSVISTSIVKQDLGFNGYLVIKLQSLMNE